ncbi:hypothetical protein Hypma_012510 [Hypsizygus marmoreus]|uniref:Uncharacterized protein n=1 Tax=Hypsizygus marmoreus TaxID=39966 RepID=A0A369JJ41_HYPMA|nr:hypothetical protein Hypma_012510 [Hypsizygus marmoreus]
MPRQLANDRKKSLSDKSDVPLVIDTDGQTVLTVLDSKKYKEAVQPTETGDYSKEQITQGQDACKPSPESDDEVQIMDPLPRTTTQARRDAPPAPSRPGVPSHALILSMQLYLLSHAEMSLPTNLTMRMTKNLLLKGIALRHAPPPW